MRYSALISVIYMFSFLTISFIQGQSKLHLQLYLFNKSRQLLDRNQLSANKLLNGGGRGYMAPFTWMKLIGDKDEYYRAITGVCPGIFNRGGTWFD